MRSQQHLHSLPHRPLAARIHCLLLANVILIVGADQHLLAQTSTLGSTALTDKIYQGNGTIDLLKNVSASQLQQHLQASGGLLLGADINENASGNESAASIGVALKTVELRITTTTGSYVFSDFFTNTTASTREQGAAAAQTRSTLFGHTGSSNITSATSGFDLSHFDDVLELRNVQFTGTLTSASMAITLLNAANSNVQGNDTFFDYSGGFEDFAILTTTDATLLEQTAAGVSDAPASVTYTSLPSPLLTQGGGGSSGGGGGGGGGTVSPLIVESVPAAPAPPWWLLAALGGLVVRKGTRRS